MKQTWRIDINHDPTKGTVFSPNPLTGPAPGDVIFWRNNTTLAHQPKDASTPPSAWQVDEIPGRQPQYPDDPSATSGSISFASAQTINYVCAFHASETGQIIVK